MTEFPPKEVSDDHQDQAADRHDVNHNSSEDVQR